MTVLLLIFLLFGMNLGSGSTETGTAPPRRATLGITATDPIAAAGRRFVPGERVRVTLRTDGKSRVRVATASRAGSFGVRFDVAAVDPCTDAIAVYAIGSSGTRAFAKPAFRECAPRGNPGR